MVASPRLRYDEWCPSCGEGVDYLDPFTGWCNNCSNLNVELTQTYKPKVSLGGLTVEISWLERNADNLDRKLAMGLGIRAAINAVYDDNRPICVSCGNEIPRSRKNHALFCGKNPKCRSARIKFKYWKNRRGYSRDDALKKALER